MQSSINELHIQPESLERTDVCLARTDAIFYVRFVASIFCETPCRCILRFHRAADTMHADQNERKSHITMWIQLVLVFHRVAISLPSEGPRTRKGPQVILIVWSSEIDGQT